MHIKFHKCWRSNYDGVFFQENISVLCAQPVQEDCNRVTGKLGGGDRWRSEQQQYCPMAHDRLRCQVTRLPDSRSSLEYRQNLQMRSYLFGWLWLTSKIMYLTVHKSETIPPKKMFVKVFQNIHIRQARSTNVDQYSCQICQSTLCWMPCCN